MYTHIYSAYICIHRLSAAERQGRAAGDMVNLLTVDVQRVVGAATGLWNALVLPAQIIVAMVCVCVCVCVCMSVCVSLCEYFGAVTGLWNVLVFLQDVAAISTHSVCVCVCVCVCV